MAKHIRCGKLFDGLDDKVRKDQTVVVENGRISFVGASAEAPAPAAADEVVDHSQSFVLPGLIDVHVHLSYGNAAGNEDTDFYGPAEFRALRALIGAQKVLRAGYTALADPTSSGRCTLSVRDAIEAGLFRGPRITTAGRQITSRQGLADFYPTWFGVPESSVGVLGRNAREAIEEIRREVKDGVDLIKLAMDGTAVNGQTGELVASYNQEEVTAIVAEAHRLGKKVVTHARGREATLYSARAGADLILHAYYMDDECLDAILESGSAVGPTLCLMVNGFEFSQPRERAYVVRADQRRAFFETACRNLERAYRAGVPFMAGTDSGFAITPYGEWHAKELEIFVKYLGFSPAEALRATTSVNATLLRDREVGALEVGRHADVLVFDGDPLADITQLQDKSRIKEILLGGETVDVPDVEWDPWKVGRFSYAMWSDMYTQDRVTQLDNVIRNIAAE